MNSTREALRRIDELEKGLIAILGIVEDLVDLDSEDAEESE